MHPTSRAAGKTIRLLLTIIVLAFWFIFLAANRQELTRYPWRLAWLPLLASWAVLAVQIVLVGSVWQQTLRLTGGELSWHSGVAIWLQAQLARYIPGGVWEYAGRYALSSASGVNRRALGLSVGVEMALQAASGAVFLVAALLLRSDDATGDFLLPALGLVAACALLLMPPVFSRLVNAGLHLLRRPSLTLRLTYSDLVKLFVLALLGHALNGLGFVLFLSGLIELPRVAVPLVLAGFIGAWLIGYLAVFVPTGMGVREGALALLLQGVLPAAPLGAAALGYRVFVALRDLMAALLGRLLQGR